MEVAFRISVTVETHSQPNPKTAVAVLLCLMVTVDETANTKYRAEAGPGWNMVQCEHHLHPPTLGEFTIDSIFVHHVNEVAGAGRFRPFFRKAVIT